MHITIIGERELLERLSAELGTAELARDLVLQPGTHTEADRLALDFKDIAALSGVIINGIKASQVAFSFIQARLLKKSILHLKTPRGTIKLDITGKSQLELTALIKSAYPFLE